MRENTYTEEELKLIISERREKIIDNASCISYDKKYYTPVNLETGEITNFQRWIKCILIIDYDGEYIGEIENKYYQMVELKNRDSVMKKESEITDSKIKKNIINIFRQKAILEEKIWCSNINQWGLCPQTSNFYRFRISKKEYNLFCIALLKCSGCSPTLPYIHK